MIFEVRLSVVFLGLPNTYNSTAGRMMQLHITVPKKLWLSQGQELPLAEWRPNVTDISYQKRSARLWSLKAHYFD